MTPEHTDAVSALNQARRMRARLLEGMLGLLRTRIIPEIRSAEARDSVEHIERTLALLLVEAQWPAALTEGYAIRAGLPLPEPGGNPTESLVRLRARAASLGDAAIAAEAWLQPHIAKARDEAGAACSSVADAGVSESDVKARLTPYLRQRFDAPELAIDLAEPIPGGRSKQTFRLQLRSSQGLPSRCVLRVDRKAALVQTQAIDEFELLQALSRLGGTASPEPLLGEGDRDILGGTFVIVNFVEGRKAGEYFPEVYGLPDRPEAVCRDLARILGRLHGAEPDDLQVNVRRIEGAAAFEQQIDADYQRARGAGLRAAEFEAAHAWLKSNLARASARPRLCHGDVGLHNLLVSNGRVTALLDWELAVIGPAAFDLASVQHLVEPVMPWSAFVEDYLRAGGAVEAVEPAHLAFHTVLRRFRINVASHSAAAMFRDAVSDDFVLANAGYDMTVRGRALLVASMAQLLANKPNPKEV